VPGRVPELGPVAWPFVREDPDLINSIDRVPRQTIYLVGHNHSIAIAGQGSPIILLHGSSSHGYGWRNIIPYLARRHHCLAPDLPGMGHSDGAKFYDWGSNTFSDMYSSVATLIQFLEPDRPVVLVGHELGAMLAGQYAREHPSSVAGLIFIEGSFRVSNDTYFDPDIQHFLSDVRGERGKSMILARNLLIEFYLNRLTSRHLGPEELRGYRDPYRKAGKSREAMLSMIRQLPLRSHPGPIDGLAEEIRRWCSASTTPKLVIGGKPGFLVPQPVLATTAKWANTRIAMVPGLHFLMEDSPARLTSIMLDWLGDIGHTVPTAADLEDDLDQSPSPSPARR